MNSNLQTMKNAENSANALTRKIFELTPSQIGKDKPILAITKNSQTIAVGSPSSSTILFVNKMGEIITKITLESNAIPLSLSFDSDDTYFCALSKDKAFIYKVGQFDTAPIIIPSAAGTFVMSSWSSKTPNLAIGSSSGAIMFLNVKTNKKVNTVGKHSKKLVHMVWGPSDQLLSIAEDKTIAVSKVTGENEESFVDLIKLTIQEPERAIWLPGLDIQSQKEKDSTAVGKTKQVRGGSSSSGCAFALTSKGGKTLNVVLPGSDLSVTDHTINSSYGKIIDFESNSKGEIIVACNRGYLCKFVMKNGSIEETKSEKLFQNAIEFAKFETNKGQAIMLGDNMIKFVEIDNLKELKDYRVTFEKTVGNFAGLVLNSSGNFLLVSTATGFAYGILVRGEFIAKLTSKIYANKVSFNQINIKSLSQELTVRSIDELEKQPGYLITFPGSEIVDFCCIREIIYVCQEKTLSCFSFDGNQAVLVNKREFDKNIEKVFASEKGRVLVVTSSSMHLISQMERKLKEISVELKNTSNTVFRFSHEFTAMLNNNTLLIYDNEDLEMISSKAFKTPIADLYMNEHTLEFFLYMPSTRKLTYHTIDTKVKGVSIDLPDKSALKSLIFDETNSNLFCLHFSSGKIYTVSKSTSHYKVPISFKVVREILSVEDLNSNEGSNLALTFLDSDITPIRLKNGFLTCVERGTTITGTYLASHSFMLGHLNSKYQEFEIESLANLEGSSRMNTQQNHRDNDEIDLNNKAGENEKEYYIKSFLQAIELGFFELALKANYRIESKKLWDVLGRTSLEHLDLNCAIICYQKLGNFSMSYYMKQLATQQRSFDDLRCEVAVILCDYEFAHKFFLEIGRPEKAAELLCNLHEFQTAAEICRQHSLDRLELSLTLELADQALKNEEFIKAQGYYEDLLNKVSPNLAKKRANSTVLDKNRTQSKASLPKVKAQKEENCLIDTDEASLYKRALFGLCSLFIRQGSALRATQTLMQIETENREDIEELAELAKEFDQFSLSAELFARIGLVNKEIEICLQAIQSSSENSKLTVDQFISKVRSNISKLTDPEVMLKVAQFIQNRDPELAESILQKSGNTVEHVKFLLFVTKNVEKAEAVFEKNRLNAQNAANYLAEYYSQTDEGSKVSQRKAIRYFLLSGRKIEAFKKAFETANIEFYCECVDIFDAKEAIVLARYFTVRNDHSRAGKFYMIANEHEKALISFIKAKNFDEAIELVYKLNDDDLFELMVQILAGETVLPDNPISENEIADGNAFAPKSELDLYFRDSMQNNDKMFSGQNTVPEPVDPIYLFKLYLRFGKVDQANTIALAIINRELIDGSYKSAHQHAFLIYSEMIRQKAKVHPELRNKYVILQSYSIVKRALKHNLHNLAALLLDRICCFIHYLPKNAAEIMTSAVIESTKAGYKLLAYNWALALCKPQYRSSINPKYKDKIEKIALKPVTTKDFGTESNWSIGWNEGQGEKMSNGSNRCPNCQTSVQDSFAISCNSCLANFIVCTASGKAILGLQDTVLMACRSCKGIGYRSEMTSFVAKEGMCPMCEEKKDIREFDVLKMDTVKELMKE